MLSQNLVQKQTQKLVITQDLRQSIELLPLSNLELSDRIQKELMENPLLEDNSDSTSYEPASDQLPADKPANPADSEDGMESFRWKESRDFNGDEFYSGGSGSLSYDESGDRKHQYLQNALSSPENLPEHLLGQLRLTNLSPEELQAGELIISDIDSRGFLKERLEDLIEGSDLTLPAARKALQRIHELDPVGCGAQDIRDSLMIQAKIINPEERVAHELLAHHFEDLERLDYKKIERNTGYGNEDIERAIHFIRTLEPFPGSLYESRQPDYILPDLIVVEVDGNLEVIINDDWMPGLKVNEDYRQILKEKDKRSDQDREYLQTKLNQALWLIKSVRQRRQTLFRVMKSIVEFQEEFFYQGHGHLKPLTLREVAEKVELHESTISRITTNKYVQTHWGIFELKYFFSSSLRSTTGSQNHSAKSIQDRIRQLISEEDSEHPFSDQEITEMIHKEGVEIARRTVAKYRKLLKILPADRRKKLKKLNTPG